MNHSLKIGFCFGMTSGVITTLGLLVGLAAGTHSKLVVISGVLVIAIADAFSDGFGIHMSEESENSHTAAEIWISTGSTCTSKFICAASFLLPLWLLDLRQAVVASLLWGAVVLTAMSWWLAVEQGKNRWRMIGEHLAIGGAVVAVSHLVGLWIGA